MGDNMGCPRKTCPISVHPGENRCVNTEFYRDILSILSQTPLKPSLSLSSPSLPFSFYFWGGGGVERYLITTLLVLRDSCRSQVY